MRSVAQACGVSQLNGKYAVNFSGAVMGYSAALDTPWMPSTQAEIGILEFDGAGNFNGTDTYNNASTPTPYNLAGTYTVNADCTGSIALNPASAGGNWNGGDIVVLANGEAVSFLKTDALTPQGAWDIYTMLAGTLTLQDGLLTPQRRIP
jgi:hypothetical protein